VLVWDVDAVDHLGNPMSFQAVVDTLRKRGEFDIEIRVTREESPVDVMTRIRDAAGEGMISSIRILAHGNVSGDKGQRIGNGYIQPEDFRILKPKLKPGGRIRLDGCSLGDPKYLDYRWNIVDITGMRVEASPDRNVIVPTPELDGSFESRSASNSTTITW
jgi:hypothetical protein